MKQQTSIEPLDSAREFDISELFFSTTDRKGIITGCNEVFTRIAAYTGPEILDEPHNIIRHPDVPRAVFSLLWEYLLDGRSIGAYVKNLAKTGEYYWVFALVMPYKDGFISVRLKPTSEIFGVVQGLYRELLEVEASAEPDWRSGMNEAKVKLLEAIGGLGFESYDDFMALALYREVDSRRRAINKASASALGGADAFSEVNVLIEFREKLCGTNLYFERLGREINRVAVNASVIASQFSDEGRTLSAISQEVSRVGVQISKESSKLKEKVDLLREVLYRTSFMISFSELLAEMQQNFQSSNEGDGRSPDEQAAEFGATFEHFSGVLAHCHLDALKNCKSNIDLLRHTLSAFQSFVDALGRIMLTLQLSYISGKSVAAGIRGGGKFAQLLEDMVSCSTAARTELAALEDSVATVRTLVERWKSSKSLESSY